MKKDTNVHCFSTFQEDASTPYHQINSLPLPCGYATVLHELIMQPGGCINTILIMIIITICRFVHASVQWNQLNKRNQRTSVYKQIRLNSTGCVFPSESVLNWVLWFTKLFAEKVLCIWGNCAFRWATISICPATGLQTEEICLFRELTRRQMAGEPSARLALLPGTVSQLRFVNRRP